VRRFSDGFVGAEAIDWAISALRSGSAGDYARGPSHFAGAHLAPLRPASAQPGWGGGRRAPVAPPLLYYGAAAGGNGASLLGPAAGAAPPSRVFAGDSWGGGAGGDAPDGLDEDNPMTPRARQAVRALLERCAYRRAGQAGLLAAMGWSRAMPGQVCPWGPGMPLAGPNACPPEILTGPTPRRPPLRSDCEATPEHAAEGLLRLRCDTPPASPMLRAGTGGPPSPFGAAGGGGGGGEGGARARSRQRYRTRSPDAAGAAGLRLSAPAGLDGWQRGGGPASSGPEPTAAGAPNARDAGSRATSPQPDEATSPRTPPPPARWGASDAPATPPAAGVAEAFASAPPRMSSLGAAAAEAAGSGAGTPLHIALTRFGAEHRRSHAAESPPPTGGRGKRGAPGRWHGGRGDGGSGDSSDEDYVPGEEDDGGGSGSGGGSGGGSRRRRPSGAAQAAHPASPLRPGASPGSPAAAGGGLPAGAWNGAAPPSPAWRLDGIGAPPALPRGAGGSSAPASPGGRRPGSARPRGRPGSGREPKASSKGPCANCGVDKSILWRCHPADDSVRLCNACGGFKGQGAGARMHPGRQRQLRLPLVSWTIA
jgi:hypothetical protein